MLAMRLIAKEKYNKISFPAVREMLSNDSFPTSFWDYYYLVN